MSRKTCPSEASSISRPGGDRLAALQVRRRRRRMTKGVHCQSVGGGDRRAHPRSPRAENGNRFIACPDPEQRRVDQPAPGLGISFQGPAHRDQRCHQRQEDGGAHDVAAADQILQQHGNRQPKISSATVAGRGKRDRAEAGNWERLQSRDAARGFSNRSTPGMACRADDSDDERISEMDQW